MFITKEKVHFLKVCSFYCCLVKKDWALKVADHFAIQGPVAYKKYKYNLNIPLRVLWLHFFNLISLFHFILRNYILTQHGLKVLYDLIFSKVQHYVNVGQHKLKVQHYVNVGQHELSCSGIGNWIWESSYWWGELNFDKTCLHFNVKKKIFSKVTVDLTVNIEY